MGPGRIAHVANQARGAQRAARAGVVRRAARKRKLLLFSLSLSPPQPCTPTPRGRQPARASERASKLAAR